MLYAKLISVSSLLRGHRCNGYIDGENISPMPRLNMMLNLFLHSSDFVIYILSSWYSSTANRISNNGGELQVTIHTHRHALELYYPSIIEGILYQARFDL